MNGIKHKSLKIDIAHHDSYTKKRKRVEKEKQKRRRVKEKKERKGKRN